MGHKPAGFVIGPPDSPIGVRADTIVIFPGQTQEARGRRQEVLVSG